MKLLKQMNQQKLHGEVNYLPLNVLKIDQNINYPHTNDVRPLIKIIKYERNIENAVRHVFDKILLCRNMDVATSLAKQYQMDCVLVEGDLISRKGALTGGYVDSRQSKLAYHRQLAQLRENLSKKEAELEQLQGEIRQIDTQLNNVLNDLQIATQQYMNEYVAKILLIVVVNVMTRLYLQRFERGIARKYRAAKRESKLRA